MSYSRGSRYLVVALVAATLITTASVSLTYSNAVRAAEDSLRLTALGIAVSLEATLSRMERDRGTLFSDIITEGRWEGIAFIALCARDGRTLLHSNVNLINRRVPDSEIREVSEKGTPLQAYSTLGTGEKVFVLYFPVHLNESMAVLKLALHTYPAEKIIRLARTQAVLISAITLALWLIAYFFLRAIKRSEIMAEMMTKREQMAVLGEMASTLAHEIRNPLGSIKGFAQYLIENEHQPNRQHLDIIVAESQRLEVLTDDLLRYAKPERFESSIFELRELMDAVMGLETSARPSDNNIRWTVDIPGAFKVNTDKNKLKQILINILRNSLDALAETAGADAAINISAERSGHGTISIIVRDNGPGMDKQARDKAFQPFFTTKTKGTGLGLAIVEKLAKSLSGSVELKSEPQRGTTVEIIIPEGRA